MYFSFLFSNITGSLKEYFNSLSVLFAFHIKIHLSFFTASIFLNVTLHLYAFFLFVFLLWPITDVFCIKITVILLLAIHYLHPCVALFIVKILSHIATAAQIHFMSGFKEQLKALL